MAAYDTVVSGGRVVTPDGVRHAGIAIKDGVFAAIGEVAAADGARAIDAGGRWVLPGIVDSHVHARDPGYTHKEDFASCSAAAAAGGVTTIMCMPNTDPLLDSADAFHATVDAAARSTVDFALQGLAVPRSLDAIPALKALGVVSFEMFLAGPEPLLSATPAERQAVLRAVAAVDGIAGIYADDPPANAVLDALGSGTPDDMVAAHPPELEVGALLGAVAMASAAHCRLHYRQMSSALAAQTATAIRRRAAPGRFTTEVTPHHLTLASDDFRTAGAAGHIMPPLRSRADIEGLWRAWDEGAIDTIGSDHAPHSWDEKTAGGGDLRRSAPGFPGLETFLPVVLGAFVERGHGVGDFVRAAAANPARLFGLYPRKGAIAVGSDADLAIVDDAASWTIDPSRFRSKARYSPYAGREVAARVDLTMVRGRVVHEDGEVAGDAGGGRLQVPDRRDAALARAS